MPCSKDCKPKFLKPFSGELFVLLEGVKKILPSKIIKGWQPSSYLPEQVSWTENSSTPSRCNLLEHWKWIFYNKKIIDCDHAYQHHPPLWIQCSAWWCCPQRVPGAGAEGKGPSPRQRRAAPLGSSRPSGPGEAAVWKSNKIRIIWTSFFGKPALSSISILFKNKVLEATSTHFLMNPKLFEIRNPPSFPATQRHVLMIFLPWFTDRGGPAADPVRRHHWKLDFKINKWLELPLFEHYFTLPCKPDRPSTGKAEFRGNEAPWNLKKIKE